MGMDPIYTYHRFSLEADCLASETEVPSEPLACACKRKKLASELFDARDYDQLPGDWACQICFSGIDRDELVEAEKAATLAAGPDWTNVRAERQWRLTASDWTQTLDAPLTAEKVVEWGAYRQALRDVTETFADPADVIWPTKPD